MSAIFRIPYLAIKKLFADHMFIAGGYAAYTALLAFFPFIIFLIAVAGMVADTETAASIIQYSLNFLPANVAEGVAPVIRSLLENESPGLLTFGALATLWVTSSSVEGLRFGLNKAYEVREFRPFWRRRLESIGVVLAGAVVCVLLVLAIIIWPLVIGYVARYVALPISDLLALDVFRFMLAGLLLMLTLGMLYRTLPNRARAGRRIWPGAALATALWLAMAQLFSLYLSYFGHYDVTYGSIGGVIVTLVFFHYSAVVVLLGAEFNGVLGEK